MKNLDLNAMSVEEMTEKEVLSVDGGSTYVDGVLVPNAYAARLDNIERIETGNVTFYWDGNGWVY